MATPTTVEEYLRQVPNPSPCPHSPVPSDPPCAECIQRRITTANALRAGQDPSVALGLVPPQAGNPDPAAVVGDAAPTPSEPVTAAPTLPGVISDQEPTLVSFDGGEPVLIPAGATATFETTQTLMEAPVSSDPNPLTPGMTHTEIQPNANNPLEALAQAGAPAPNLELTPEQQQRRAAIEAGTHPAVVELPAMESTEAPASVPRSVALGVTQERYEPGATIAFPEPGTGNVFKLYIEEFLELGDVVMVNPLTGRVCKYREPFVDADTADIAGEPGPAAEPEAPAPSPDSKPLTPAGHRDAIIKLTNELWPHLGADKTNVSQITAGLFARLREFEQAAPMVMEHIATPEPTHVTLQAGQTFDQQMDSAEAQIAAAQAPKPIEQAVPLMDAAAASAVAAVQAQEAPTPPPVPQAAPVAPPPADDPIAAAAAVAAPQNVPAEQLATTCEHGMPGTDFSTNPPRSAACPSCMMNSDGPPPHMTKLHASRFQQAYLDSKCARDMCGREIHVGELIGLVDNVGWCCGVCTKPERTPAA